MTFDTLLKALFTPAGRRPSSTRLRTKAGCALRPRLEALDERVVPVVNAAAGYPTATPPGSGFDDVVQLFSPGGRAGTGTLLSAGPARPSGFRLLSRA